MPRQRHNDAAEPAKDPCGRCGHLRGKHRSGKGDAWTPACTALVLDPLGPSKPCPCQWFVKRKSKPKAADATVAMTLTWEGDHHPSVGDFLMSPHRPKFGYQIVDLYVTKSGQLDIKASRVPIAKIPKGVKVHAFRWNPRDAQRKDKRPAPGWSS